MSVVHSGGTATKTFDQRVNGGQWLLHGRYAFAAGKLGYVEMTETNGLGVANAVRFVLVTDGGDTTTTTQKHVARLRVQATYGPTLTAIDAIAAPGVTCLTA